MQSPVDQFGWARISPAPCGQGIRELINGFGMTTHPEPIVRISYQRLERKL
jgi:hypothetical protein